MEKGALSASSAGVWDIRAMMSFPRRERRPLKGGRELSGADKPFLNPCPAATLTPLKYLIRANTACHQNAYQMSIGLAV